MFNYEVKIFYNVQSIYNTENQGDRVKVLFVMSDRKNYWCSDCNFGQKTEQVPIVNGIYINPSLDKDYFLSTFVFLVVRFDIFGDLNRLIV